MVLVLGMGIGKDAASLPYNLRPYYIKMTRIIPGHFFKLTTQVVLRGIENHHLKSTPGHLSIITLNRLPKNLFSRNYHPKYT